MGIDILLYGYIYSYNALFFFEQVNKALYENPEAELTLRINTSGGEPDFMQEMARKAIEIANQVHVKVGATCNSAGFLMLAYIPAERIEALDVTNAVLHRAAYPSYIEKAPEFADSAYSTILKNANKGYEKALRAKMDVTAFEALPQMAEKGLKLKDVFSMETRHDIVLTGADLKKVGLVGKVVRLEPAKLEEMNAATEKFNAATNIHEIRMVASTISKSADTIIETESKNDDTIMDLKELKAKFPAIYAEAVAEGRLAGVQSEKDRIEAIMVYADVDLEECKKAIEAGTNFTAKQQALLSRKSVEQNFSKDALKDLEGDAAKAVTTTEVKGEAKPATEKEKSIAAFEASLDLGLGLNKN
jgi:ATP-dependent protease ClpP protease subunit